MKKILFPFLVLSSFLVAADFACVDTNRIIRESKFITKAQQELKRELEKYQQMIVQKQREMEDLKKALESKVLSENARKKKMEELEKLEEDLRKLQVEAQTKLSRKKAELEKLVFDRIINIVKEKAKAEKLKAVFDCNTMLYTDKLIDITEEVLRELDK